MMSLWDRVKANLTPPEVVHVASSIGQSLIDTNDSLYREYDALDSILQELKTRNDMNLGNRLRRKKLPDAPERKMLEGKVRLLLDAIKKNGESAAGSITAKDEEMYKYFNDNNNNGSNGPDEGGSSSGSQGRRTSSARMSNLSPSSSFAPASTRSAPDVLESLAPHLNALSVDQVVAPLREAFEDEKTELLQDIQMMQAILEHENERGKSVMDGGGRSRPNIEDLRQFGNRLEETLRQQVVFKDIPSRPAFSPVVPSRSCGYQQKNDEGTMRSPSSGVNVSKLDISPLRSRLNYNNGGGSMLDDASHGKNSSGEGNISGGRMRSQLNQQIANSKFEETLSDDDLKFFS